MDEIVVNFKWTADELVAGYRWHCRHRERRVLRAFLWGVALLFIAAGAFGIYSSGEGSGWFLIVLGVFCILALTGFESWYLRRQFQRRPDRDADIEWRISADRFLARSNDIKSEFTWQALAKVIQTPDGFLFYPIEQIFHWLPRHAFSSDADIDALGELAQQRAANFVRIGSKKSQRRG